MPHSRQKRAVGFTLIELLFSLSIFLIICGAVFGGMAGLQKGYRRLEIQTALQQRMGAALELMAQEINQAGVPATNISENGVVTGALATSSFNVTAGSSNVALSVSTTTNIFPGQQLWLDIGSSQEEVTVTGIGSGTVTIASVQNAHNGSTTPFPILTLGVYANSILPGSTSTKLELFGDITATGDSMNLITYVCPAVYPGSLMRNVYSVTDSTATAISSVSLLDNLTVCSFAYNNAVPVPGFTNQVSTTVSISLAAQSQTRDPETGAYISVTKSFLNIQPRSLNAALRRYLDYGDTSTLQHNPTNGIFTNLP